MHNYLQLDIYMDKTWLFSKELTRINVIECLGGAEWDEIIYALHFMVYQKDSTLSPTLLRNQNVSTLVQCHKSATTSILAIRDRIGLSFVKPEHCI